MKKNWDTFCMDFAYDIAKQSRAEKKQVGAVLTRDDLILGYGYNGTPSGYHNECEHRTTEGLVTLDTVVHAEMNAILKVARSNESTQDATIYTTYAPCFQCAKNIITAGIRKVVYSEQGDHSEEVLSFLRDCNIDHYWEGGSHGL
jgi:dCMP deaminase